MISIVRASERYHLEEGWLSTCHHFSFDTYRDPKNMGWGALRVFNDDFIAPGGKFGMHPHANYEIITIVLEGAIQHEDSEGHRGAVRKNEVQAMTAGSGIRHSEANPGKSTLHSLQIWIEPDKRNLQPTYAQASFSEADFRGKLCPLVSGKGNAPLSIHQAAAIYRCALSKGETIIYSPKGRHAYVYAISGSLVLNGQEMSDADSAKILDENRLAFSTQSSADFILFSLP